MSFGENVTFSTDRGDVDLPVSERLLWRWVITDLNGIILTLLDNLATNRSVTRNLVAPSEMSGTVPSDNPEINILSGFDGDPFLSEGNRLLFGFRKENPDEGEYPDFLSPWVIRASGLITTVQEATQQDDATTTFTAYDPKQYLYQLPVLKSTLAQTKAGDFFTVDGYAGNAMQFLPAEGAFYPKGMKANEILIDVLLTALIAVDAQATNLGITVPAGVLNAFMNLSDGIIEDCPTFDDRYPIQQGWSVGQVFEDIQGTGVCDIVMQPLWDPINWPGILATLNIYDGATGACSHRIRDESGYYIDLPAHGPADLNGFNDSAVFAWDRFGHSLSAIQRLLDGSQRANQIMGFVNGTPVYDGTVGSKAPLIDVESTEKFGPYISQQFLTNFPSGKAGKAAGLGLFKDQLILRRDHKTTITVNPAPESSPEPFIDYDLGDRVPMYAGKDAYGISPLQPPYSNSFLVDSNQFRQELLGYSRIVGVPIDIDDNGVETVRELILGPTEDPSGVDAIEGTTNNRNRTAVNTSRQTNRGGAATSAGR